ncbi:hypothetical protein LDENG_00116390 [Lucifuga dentata]|nr:hypothetical protein LDENG_00116390 [Lucifuga dentata]
MKTKEHSKQLCEKVIEKHKSGEGYKKISKSVNIPWSSVKSIIKKWKACGTTVNLPRAGRAPKLSDRARRRLVREATKTPMTTLKELQGSVAAIGESVQTTTVAWLLHQSQLFGRAAQRNIRSGQEHALSCVLPHPPCDRNAPGPSWQPSWQTRGPSPSHRGTHLFATAGCYVGVPSAWSSHWGPQQ